MTVEVLNRDDRLLLHNTSGKDVVILGYDDEPYARVLADGTVEVNTDSEAYYLNDDRFANVEVPAGVDGKGEPQWKEVAQTGRFEWHDHRAHWMGKGDAAAGHGPGRADEGLRLVGADRGRRRARRDRRDAVLDAAARRRRRRSARSSRGAGCPDRLLHRRRGSCVRRRRGASSAAPAEAW